MIYTEGIKYIGSKRKLLSHIVNVLNDLECVNTVLDGFAGTTRVGQAFRHIGYKVLSNDLSDYSFAFGKCYLESDLSNIDITILNEAIEELNNLGGIDGILTKYYSGGSTSIKNGNLLTNEIMFWKRKNTMKADAIRAEIEKFKSDEKLYYCLLTSLIVALDKVDNTVGVQQAFLKNSWAQRASNNLVLNTPYIPIEGPTGMVFKEDTNLLVDRINVDLSYFDPPYTSHNYSSYYHIWDTVVTNSISEVSGIINRPKTVKKSKYNYKNEATKAFTDLLKKTKSKYILISYNNEGIISFDDIITVANTLGDVKVTGIDYKRNIMHKIGICNNIGEVVGIPGKSKNIEYLILISR